MNHEVECRARAIYTGDDRLVRISGFVSGIPAKRVEIVGIGESDEPDPTLHLRIVAIGNFQTSEPLRFDATFAPRRWVRYVQVDGGTPIAIEE